MTQRSFASAEYAMKSKRTRPDTFLGEVERIVPWSRLMSVIEPLYPKSGRVGRQQIGVPKMLRMYCLQQWYSLTDKALEDALYDSQALRDFVGIDLSRESMPDATTLLKFRRLLQANDLTRALFDEINAHLSEQGLLMRTGIGLRLDPLDDRPAEALVRFIESGINVHTKHQFFVWVQSWLQELAPHRMLVCGSRHPYPELGLVFEAVHAVPLATSVLDMLTDCASPLMQQLTGAWLGRRGKPLPLPLQALQHRACADDLDRLLQAGLRSLLMHGVSRHHGAEEIDTLFLLWCTQEQIDVGSQRHVELVMPYLHSTYLRVVHTERSLGTRTVPDRTAGTHSAGRIVSAREAQILHSIRLGQSSQEIADLLRISPHTVRNHVQKILRKLGATNRAQAVAKALMLGLLSPSPDRH